MISAEQKRGGEQETALSEGVSIDTQDDESVWQETVCEFEITDVGESRVCHEGRSAITVGITAEHRMPPSLLSTAPDTATRQAAIIH